MTNWTWILNETLYEVCLQSATVERASDFTSMSMTPTGSRKCSDSTWPSLDLHLTFTDCLSVSQTSCCFTVFGFVAPKVSPVAEQDLQVVALVQSRQNSQQQQDDAEAAGQFQPVHIWERKVGWEQSKNRDSAATTVYSCFYLAIGRLETTLVATRFRVELRTGRLEKHRKKETHWIRLLSPPSRSQGSVAEPAQERYLPAPCPHCGSQGQTRQPTQRAKVKGYCGQLELRHWATERLLRWTTWRPHSKFICWWEATSRRNSMDQNEWMENKRNGRVFLSGLHQKINWCWKPWRTCSNNYKHQFQHFTDVIIGYVSFPSKKSLHLVLLFCSIDLIALIIIFRFIFDTLAAN